MKIPEEIKAYCKKCRKHTLHKVKKEKKGATASMSWGQRQYERVKRGHGSKRRGEKDVSKVNKGGNLMLECKDCKQKSQRPYARSKKEPAIGQQ